jgi:phosphoenolpyruvate---glycerone phosphotransferase subunit DhaL
MTASVTALGITAPPIEGTSSMIDVLEAWLRLAAGRVHETAAALTALDQAIGDGDHGINMDRGFTAIVAALDAGRPEADGDRAVAGAVLRTAGRTLISTVGGASGPLYGTAFMRAGAAVAAADPAATTADVLVAALEAGIAGIEALGKATTGEKTMLDALVPAARAGREVAAGGGDAAAVTAAFAEAAEAGAAATIPLLATKGRASYLGERSIGHQDPGATSAALLLRALADASPAGDASAGAEA